VITAAVSFPTVTITPDTKDWTWVLRRPCPECGLDTQRFAREAVADMTRVNAAAWHDLLTGPTLLASGGRPPQTPPLDLRGRPEPEVWSALEYGCHVRDVFRRFDGRLTAMLTEDGPRFANWDQDATAVADHYGEQDPAAVAAQLREAAEALAARFDAVSGDQWQRTGTRSDGAAFTVESFARYYIHDPVHHLYDVTRAQHAHPQEER
jgi:DinB superfamily